MYLHLLIKVRLPVLSDRTRLRIHVYDGQEDQGLVAVLIPLISDGLDQTCPILSAIEAVEQKLNLEIAGV